MCSHELRKFSNCLEFRYLYLLPWLTPLKATLMLSLFLNFNIRVSISARTSNFILILKRDAVFFPRRKRMTSRVQSQKIYKGYVQFKGYTMYTHEYSKNKPKYVPFYSWSPSTYTKLRYKALPSFKNDWKEITKNINNWLYNMYWKITHAWVVPPAGTRSLWRGS